MVFLLNSSNVFDYLSEQNLFNIAERDLAKVELIEAKNFNLLVTLPDDFKLLIKQERYQKDGKALGEFLGEWRIKKLLDNFSELENLRLFLPEIFHFDPDNSILVFKYLDNYRDLNYFYHKEKIFPASIASAIGTFLGLLHRETFQKQLYHDFLSKNNSNSFSYQVTHLINKLERITPEIFSTVPADCLKFFVLYQKYDSLGQSLAELGQTFTLSCLTHNDLKLNNILLNKNLVNADSNFVRFIDWERANWGAPESDLGMIIGSYLQLWLESLVISKSLTLEDSLRLATTPLEKIQPSLVSLVQSYLTKFPEIMQVETNFLERVIQWAGFTLIQQIQAMIQYQKAFGNMGIAMLQVGKTLLCRPQQSMTTVFGKTAIYS